MIVDPNTTIIDLAFNLYGSLAGVPAILQQLPAGARIGFSDMPSPGSDVNDIGQTWTPGLVEKELDITVSTVYNELAKDKAPFTTDLASLQPIIEQAQGYADMIVPGYTQALQVTPGMNLQGATLFILNTQMLPDSENTVEQYIETTGGYKIVYQQIVESSTGQQVQLISTSVADPSIYGALYKQLFQNPNGWVLTQVKLRNDIPLIVAENTLLGNVGNNWGWNFAYFSI